ncbi:MAG: glycosyltransferase family 2 protein [Bacteroidales bacterium]
MISVCIPVYCYDARKLVETMYFQGQQLSVAFEVIVIDDGSPAEWQKINAPIREKAQYIILSENVGRAAVRNLFLKHSRYDWLFFLDSDVMPVDNAFLKRYLETIERNPGVEVICGGIRMPNRPDNGKQLLRWHYGNVRECRPMAERQQQPYRSFMTGNFCIRKDTLKRFPFDERLRQYGHEDTLLGFRLMQHRVPLLHIDNPVFHLHLEEAETFIRKTEQAVANLYHIASTLLENDSLFVLQNRLLRKGYMLRRYRLHGLLQGWFFLFRPLLRRVLLKGKYSLWLFDIYKLGYLCSIMGRSLQKSD